MAINLKSCDVDPKQYVEITNHNLKEINGIEREIAINNLVKELSNVSKIEYQICLLDLKSYLMNSYSYYPYHLRVKLKNILLYTRFLISNFLHSVKPKRPKQIDLIIDDWTKGIVFPFYGEELIGKLTKSYKCEFFNFNEFKGMNAIDVFLSFFKFIKCMLLAHRIINKHRIDLREYVFRSFANILSGKAIRKFYKPKLIISGHQNGFSTIKAKAAGAEVVLIPNGVSGYFGDTAFKYADHFISIGGKHFIEAASKFGCSFKNTYSFGALRVHNFNKKTKNRNFNIIYDLLWVGCGVDLLSDYSREGYTIQAECEAIKLINKYAAQTDLKVAYHCRHDDDVEKLKKLELFSEKIEYLPPTYSEKTKETKNVYEAVKESRLVMSSLSGVCHEAFAFGKKFAFVNMSGNVYLNYPYRNAGVEYNLSSKISFDEFVDEVKNKEVDPRDYIVQNPDYVKDLICIIDEVIKKY
ncbi:hypothetical protein A3J90_07050 [candidate division WOR-1 bacterium RIFOXYC2_FULL_37_10]|uniref:Uncharacterized protein n=1 Tax=candidate division WOR-1 bacterium RIFOXYB2_FULL_37_13 TaxID=1802579 RepID=A0A1F4SQB5_UNCSA|nr:MAG: hypothetical protein A2310_07615 [candidate division WOR-1 bacterium RIFOXYB2_FULL_37_13]OGC34241.1 MAG: hypothetical protein A3J90_07050 [candidate division WOR-1 bacterium RIFOXYC2_FULL_37_10]